MKELNVRELSSVYDVRKMQAGDVKAIFALCRENTQFYAYCGKELTVEMVKTDLIITPPGIPPEQKYYVGFFDGDVLVAVMDLVCGYPDDETAYIGFFMMNSALQGRGIGSGIVSQALEYAQRQGFKKCRLGIDKENPQSNHFWKKNGFAVVFERVQEDGVILVAERLL